ncbi:TadE/TadG family type IV pilus assembly protein [Mesorhizobium sp. 1M-11]|uniref:TadE/TadG family type IV pilus assembly protein n=1 Tax=Mesorhizobium sp. 1M-11 TaxID=1529006 RepID=UPI0006C73BF5|nr:TadE/TadG family type IV pilus assembly protein [Mesorhizobium sp. 1M-11]
MGQAGKRGSEKRAARRRGFLGRFARDRRGSTAIEFAALAIPFALLVFAILESCLSFAGQEVLTNATDDIARQLRTGQLKVVTVDSLKQKICHELEILMANECTDRLKVDLRKYDSYVEAAGYSYKIANGEIVLMKGTSEDQKQFVAEPGGAETINMLRVFYKWPVITDFLAKSMAGLDFKGSRNSTLHFATNTWFNEPYGS